MVLVEKLLFLTNILFIFKNLVIGKVVNQSTQLVVYYAYFVSQIKCSITVWEHSTFSNKIFIAKKEAVCLIAGVPPSTTSKNVFQNLKTLTFYSYFI